MEGGIVRTGVRTRNLCWYNSGHSLPGTLIEAIQSYEYLPARVALGSPKPAACPVYMYVSTLKSIRNRLNL